MAQFCKVGFHAGVGGNRTGIGDYMRQLDEAGIPFSVKSTDDVGLAIEAADFIKASGVPHNVILRFTSPGGGHFDLPNFNLSPEESAVDHWNRVKGTIPDEFEPYKGLVWIEPTNEIDTHTKADWLGWFMFHIGQLMVADGYKGLLSGFNAGQPEPEHWELAGMLSYLEACAANPERLGISLHEGKIGDIFAHPSDFHPHLIGRYARLFEACDNMGIARPNVFITEWAWKFDDMADLDTALRDVKWLSELIAQTPQVRGVFLWNLGAQQGPLADKLQQLIAPLTAYALETRFPDPEAGPVAGMPSLPPEREPRRLQHEIHFIHQDTTLAELQALTAHLHPKRSAFTYSHDVVEAVMAHSTPEGTIHVWEPGRWGADLRQFFAWLGVNYVEHSFTEI